MAASPIAWHKQCLANRKANAVEMSAICDRMIVNCKRESDDIAFYEAQIAEAERLAKVSFDRSKFMVKRKF